VIVIDASAFLEVLLRSTYGLTVEALLKDTMAPDLLDAEVFHRLVRAEQSGALQPR
jgi:predicted nucleic acid-binding protein